MTAEQRIRALLVEGNPGDVRTLREMMILAGDARVDLAIAGRPSKALQQVRDQQYDALVLDLALPDQGAFMAAVRSDAPDLPVVVLAAEGEEQRGEAAVAGGAQDYLVKGRIDGRQLARSLRYAVERAHALREQRRLRQELQETSMLDALTRVYGRTAFTTFGQHLLQVAERTKMSMQLLVARVNGIERINDEYGRHVGDLALVDTAGILKQTFRQSDLVGRVSGDRFGVLAVGAAASSAEILAARLQIQVRAHAAKGHRRFTLSLSFGTAAYDPASPCTLKELLAEAEQQRIQRRQIAV